MGINLTWVCHKHKRHHTSIRGEEGLDFQAFVRMPGCPGTCLREGTINVYHDGYFVDKDYAEIFPDWEDRPGAREKRGERPYD